MPAANRYEGHSFDELKGVSQDDSLESKEYRAAKKEAEKRAETPTNHEIEALMEKSTHNERLEMSKAMVEGALKAADLWEKPLDPSKATELDEEGLQKLCNRPSSEDGPEIYFKQVARKVTKGPPWNRREVEVPTDEVLVVVRLNNGEDKRLDEATVVTAVVKHRQGVLQVNGPALFGTRSERQFRDTLNPEAPDGGGEPERSSLNKLMSGELTHFDYLQAYRKENKQSLQQYWHQHDRAMVNKPEYWGTKEAKEEMMKRLTGKYTEVLTGMNEQLDRIKQETEAAKKASEAKVEALSNNHEFLKTVWSAYTSELRRRTPNPSMLKMWENMMVDRGITTEEIQALKDKLGTGKI